MSSIEGEEQVVETILSSGDNDARVPNVGFDAATVAVERAFEGVELLIEE